MMGVGGRKGKWGRGEGWLRVVGRASDGGETGGWGCGKRE